MALTIGELVAYLKTDDSRWNLSRAKDDLDDVAARTRSFGNDAAASFLKVATSASNITTATHTIAGVATVATQASGAIGLLPAAGAGALAAIVALKVGVAGFGDALANAGDPAAFAESLEELSPAAREAAIAARDLHDEWSAMQDNVQDQLFEGLADDVRSLGQQYIPVLSKGLGDINAQFNAGTQRTAQFLAQGAQVQTVAGFFLNTRDAVGELTGAMQPAVSILLDLVGVGSEFLPGMTSGFTEAARSAAEFVHNARETGELEEWISQGLSTLGDLWQLLESIAAIGGEVFSAFDAGGAGFLQLLLEITGGVREFLQTVEGQQALRALASALGTVASVASSVLMVALRQLAPIVIALAPGFAQLATQVGSMLVSALQVAGPLLLMLAQFLSDNVSWLGPIAIGLYAAAQAFGVVSAAVRILNVISAVNPWVIIIAATIALVTFIVTHWNQIVDFVRNAVTTVVSWVKENWPLLISIILGPLGVIIALVVTHWNQIRDATVAAFNAVRDWIRDRINDVLDIVSWLASLPGRVASWFGSVRDAAVGKLGELVSWVSSLPGRILGAIGDFGSLLFNAGADLLRGLINGISSMVRGVIDKVVSIGSNILSTIKGALGIGSPSKEFHKIGVWSGQGLIRGLDEMAGPVEAAALRIAQAAMPQVATTTTLSSLGQAAKEILDHWNRGGRLFEDFSFYGNSQNVKDYNDQIADMYNGGDVGQFLQGLIANQTQRSTVHIENYHPPADAPPSEVAADLDWFSRAGG